MALSACRTMVFAAALGGVVFLVGCTDDGEMVPVRAPVLVKVSDEADGSPVAGVKVIVMDPDANLPVAGPLLSGSDGLCDFGNPACDDLRFLAFGGVDFRVHALPENWVGKSGAPGRPDPYGHYHSMLAPT